MAAETFHLLNGYFSRAINRLHSTPPRDILPLLTDKISRRLHEHLSPQRRQMPTLVRDYIIRTFPEKAAPVISNFRHNNGGWENEMYSFNVTWGPARRRKTENMILCIYPEAAAQKKADNEYRALSSLHKAGYPVPPIMCYEQAGDRLSQHRPFIILERVTGRRMWQPLVGASGAARDRLLAEFCGLLTRLHALDWRLLADDPAARAALAGDQVVAHYLADQQAEVERVILPGFRTSWEWIVTRGHSIASPGPSIVHFDFHPGNIILCDHAAAPCGGAVVVDWTAVNLTDYRFDLAWTLLLLSSYLGDEMRAAFLAEYAHQSATRVADMEYFEAVACFTRLLGICIATTQGAKQVGLRTGIEKVMLRQASLVQRIYGRYRELTNLAIPEVQQFLQRVGVWCSLVTISASSVTEVQQILQCTGV